MTTIKIETLGREIEFLPYTRKISRPYKAALMRGININTSQSMDPNSLEMELPVSNQLEAEEILIKGITGLTDTEMDSLLDDEYQELAKAVNAYTADKKK